MDIKGISSDNNYCAEELFNLFTFSTIFFMQNKGLFLILPLCALAMTGHDAVAQNPQGGAKGNGAVVTSRSSIAGFVFDKDGEPLVGATVRIAKSKTGTATNAAGAFVIPGGANSVLVVNYIGKKPVEVKASPGKPLRIVLEDSDAQLDEVVVTGIVTKDKNSFTGSASSFTGEQLKAMGVQNPLTSLSALDPAFNILTNELMGSDPNHLPDINIRGKSSIIGVRDDIVNDPNQPLFIVDGFESTLQAVYNLDINRIESMTILKDAASTAIYGSKAANGVVVVETVKPKMGKLRFNYNGSATMQRPDLDSYSLMNASEKLEFERLAGRYTPNYSLGPTADILYSDIYNQRVKDISSGVDTYWLSAPLRTGWNQKHNVYVDGGNGGFMFGIGAGYNGTTGVMKDSKRDGVSGNIDLIYRLGDLRFQNKFSASYTDTQDPIVSFNEYAQANPYYKKYDEFGNVTRWLQHDDFATAANPMYNAALNSRQTGNSLVLTDYFMVEYSPIRQFRFSAKVGLTHTTDDGENFRSPKDTRFEGREAQYKGTFNSTYSKQTRYDGSVTAVYAEVFGNSRVNVATDFKLSEDRGLNQGYSVTGFPEGNYTYPSFSNGYPENGYPTYYESVRRSLNFLGTVNYAYDSRYLMDANYALSGSSVFGSSRMYINTWSVGLGWNIMNEKFFKEAFPYVTMLKLRGSVGNPGNQGFNSAMTLLTYRFLFSGFNYFGNSTVLDKFGNRDLRWQTTQDRNIGIDFNTENWQFELEYYNKLTDPLVIGVGVPLSTGITGNWTTNMGIQRSQGVLGSVQYYIIRNMKHRNLWSVRLTARTGDTKIDKLNGVLDELNKVAKTTSTRRYYDGADPDAIWAVRSAGIDPANGREMYIKKDGSFTYEYNPNEEVIVGNTRSKIEGYAGTNFTWQGFTVGVNFNYRWGGKALNSALFNRVENITGSQLVYNQDKRALYDRWQKPGDMTQFKNIANSQSTPISSRFVQRNNSVSLQSLNLSYDFYKYARQMGMENLRLSFYANDLFWLSTIKQERGTAYPFARSFTFALTLSL